MKDIILSKQEQLNIVNRVSVITMIGNIILSAFKFMAGIVGNSTAMISDAVHSASDVVSTIVVIIGINLSKKDADESHPYGHDRLESIAALILGGMLFVTAIGIGYSGMQKIWSSGKTALAIPGGLALVAAIVSIVSKEWMYQYTKVSAKKVNSNALMADAWHHRSDAMSSVGSLIGIGGAMLGFPIMDPLASLVICLLIVQTAWSICKKAVDQLVDKSADNEIVQDIWQHIASYQEVLAIDMLKTRMHVSGIYVDIEISVDGRLSLIEAHHIAEIIHDELEEEFQNIRHCMIHVNPALLKSDASEQSISSGKSSSSKG